jgi:hypothetical protein
MDFTVIHGLAGALFNRINSSAAGLAAGLQNSKIRRPVAEKSQIPDRANVSVAEH